MKLPTLAELQTQILKSSYRSTGSRLHESKIQKLWEELKLSDAGVAAAVSKSSAPRRNSANMIEAKVEVVSASSDDMPRKEPPAEEKAESSESSMPPFSPNFAQKLKDKTRVRPLLSQEEVSDVENFAFAISKANPSLKPMLERFMRLKLGSQYKIGWRQRGGVAFAADAKADELAMKRPQDGQLFRVEHTTAEQEVDGPRGPRDEARPKHFAVVELAGSQHKVTVDDVLAVNHISDLDIGQTLELDRVMLVGSARETLVGRPYVPQAKVIAVCEQQTKEEKILAFYKKEKTNSQRSRGFRREVTVLRITDVIVSGASSKTSGGEEEKRVGSASSAVGSAMKS